MNLRPLFDRIIVKPAVASDRTPGGLYIPSTVKGDEPQLGTVVATGKGRYDRKDRVTMETKVGDTILFGAHGGLTILIEGTEYLIMREVDVIAVQNPAKKKTHK